MGGDDGSKGGEGGGARGGTGGNTPGGGGGSPAGGGSSGSPGGSGGAGSGGSGGAATGGSGGAPRDGAPPTGDSRPADMGTVPPADAPPAVEPPPGGFDCSKLLAGGGPMSQWVYPDGKGKLAYKGLGAGGDHIMDFSHAGYMGGGVALPTVPMVESVAAPSGGDDLAAIQGAIDAASKRPLVSGFRGAVVLGKGSYQISGALHITASGVVLRGAGSAAGGTELRFPGAARRVMFIQGAGGRTLDTASSVTITDDNVPAGSSTFTVSSVAGFKVGDEVMVGRPVTAAWISLLGMDKLVRNGAQQTWISAGTVLRGERVITAIAGNKITVDVPIPDSFDAQYVKPPGGSIVKYSFAGRITQVGLEGLRFVGSPRAAGNDFHFIQMSAVADAWIKDVVAHDFTNGIVISDSAKRITVEDTIVSHTMGDYFTAAAPSDMSVDGSQVFIHRSGSRGGNKIFYYSTAGGVVGPNVVMGFSGSGVRSHVQPHMRWATGLLVDSTSLDDGNIEYINRGTAGSGHGWAMGWGVIWNSASSTIRAEQPAGAANWAIGNKGTQAGNGTFDSHGTPVNPKSLYLAQLCVRLGPQALANIGYK
jgi:hypothetical protein